MTQLTCKSVVTVEQLTVDHDTRAYAGAEGDDDEVLHATGHAIDHLADSGGIGIVGESHGDVVEALAEEFSEGHYTVVSPRQIGGKLDGAVIVIAIGGANAHGLDLIDAANLVDDDLQGLDTCVDIVLDLFIAAGLDSGCSLDVTTGIDNAEH